MLASPLLTQERERETSAPHSEFITLTEKVLSPVHHTFVPVRRETRGDVLTQEKIKLRFNYCAVASFRKSRILSEHRDIREFLELCELIKLPEEKKLLYQDSLKREYHTRLSFEEQKNHLLSEARFELDMQELRVDIADRALQESGLQLHSQRMELFQANRLYDYSMREKNCLCKL